MGSLYKDHETGKPSSIFDYYTTQRKVLNEKLSLVREEYKLSFIEKEFNHYLSILEENFPDYYRRFKASERFNQTNDVYMETDPGLALVSYLKFIEQKRNFYKEVERLNYCDVKWLQDFNSFVDFYEVLAKYNIVEVSFADFKRFWSLNSVLAFNSNKYETVVLLYTLSEHGYITDSTAESMIEKTLVIARNGKTRKSSLLSKSDFTRYKSDYKNDSPDHKPTKNFEDAMFKFGIKLIVKK